MLFRLLALLLLAAPLAAQDPTPTYERPPEGLVVSAEDLYATMPRPEVVILHVAQELAHYEAGHVPGARFVPLSALVEDRDGRLNLLAPEAQLIDALERAGVSDASRVIVYGDRDGLAASRAFLTLDALGLDVAVLDGGLDAWRAAGYDVETEGHEVVPGTITARVDRSLFVDADWVAQRLAFPSVLLVDARPAGEYRGEQPGANIERPGHIPGAVNLPWQASLRDDGTFLPRVALRTNWAEAGATPDRTIVTYCRTGMQASHAYLTARLLGHRPLIYDGSFHEWSNHTAHPVARPGR